MYVELLIGRFHSGPSPAAPCRPRLAGLIMEILVSYDVSRINRSDLATPRTQNCLRQKGETIQGRERRQKLPLQSDKLRRREVVGENRAAFTSKTSHDSRMITSCLGRHSQVVRYHCHTPPKKRGEGGEKEGKKEERKKTKAHLQPGLIINSKCHMQTKGCDRTLENVAQSLLVGRGIQTQWITCFYRHARCVSLFASRYFHDSRCCHRYHNGADWSTV
ncbi:hypothetical protein F5X96DRAFT_27393 [Biscogniauxia mediterranea]|nr:hypothetical protein F5X96DRAFT_27393 [Biscogniauxia mediterranea]